LLLAGFTTPIVSGPTTVINVGVPSDLLRRRAGAWLLTRAIAFPIVLDVRPAVARVVTGLTASRQTGSSSPR